MDDNVLQKVGFGIGDEVAGVFEPEQLLFWSPELLVVLARDAEIGLVVLSAGAEIDGAAYPGEVFKVVLSYRFIPDGKPGVGPSFYKGPDGSGIAVGNRLAAEGK